MDTPIISLAPSTNPVTEAQLNAACVFVGDGPTHRFTNMLGEVSLTWEVSVQCVVCRGERHIRLMVGDDTISCCSHHCYREYYDE